MVATMLALPTFSISSCRKSQSRTVILATLPNSIERPHRRHCRYGTGFCHTADILIGDEMQVCQHVALVLIAGNLLRILNATEHEVRSTATLRVNMDGHSLLVGLHNQLHHLVVVVETLCAMIAGLVEVILVLPTSVCLRKADKCRCFRWKSQFIVNFLCRFNSFSYLCNEITTYCEYGCETDREYY